MSDDVRRKLRDWRNKKAAELGRPMNMIFKNNALEDMSNKLPRTVDALLSCQGIGAETARKYGTELLSIINPGTACGAARAVCAAIPEAKSRSGTYWSPAEEEVLTIMYMAGATVKTMAVKLGRTNYAVQLRIQDLGLPSPQPQPAAAGQVRRYEGAAAEDAGASKRARM